MYTDYFECKECGQIFRITVINGMELDNVCMCPTCGDDDIDFCSDAEGYLFDGGNDL